MHPGGTSAIVSHCGTDATTAFTTNNAGGHNHSSSARAMLPSYYAGDVMTSTPPPTPSPTPTPSPSGTPTTYSVNVTSAGNISPTSLGLILGDSIQFTYTSSGGEAQVRFAPSTIAGFTMDSENSTRTVTFSASGAWTIKVKDKNGNTASITVQ